MSCKFTYLISPAIIGSKAQSMYNVTGEDVIFYYFLNFCQPIYFYSF